MRAKLWYMLGYCVALAVFVMLAIPLIPMSLEWYFDGVGREMRQRISIAIPVMVCSGAAALWCAKNFFRQTESEKAR